VAEVVTGEAVVLEVPCARFPSRLLALGLDMLLQLILLFVLFLIAGVAAQGGGLNPAATGAVVITLLVLAIVGYPVLWETLTRGASPGKFALGLRVVSDDGGPERFRQALVRGLAAVVEIWLLLGCPALICSLLSDRGKRLGDLFAGTFVIQQRLPARRNAAPLPPVSPELMHWGASLELSGLTEQTAETARRYLARLPELTPAAQAELGQRIAGAVSAEVSPPPPPGTPLTAYLSAVLAERRNREQARLAPAPAVGPGVLPGGQTAWPGYPAGEPAWPAYPAAGEPAWPGYPAAGPAAVSLVPPGAPPPPAVAPGAPGPPPAAGPPATQGPPTTQGPPSARGEPAWSPEYGAANQAKEEPPDQPARDAGGFVPPA
jgi:uncharacterized RDD family membrane protein YckC